MPLTPRTGEHLLYLDSAAVTTILDGLDPVAIVRSALAEWDAGKAVLPGETCLRWDVPPGGWARSLCLPAALGAPVRAAGVKVINGNPTNPDRGLLRAGGVILLFEPVSAQISTIMSAGEVSAARTAAVTAIGAHLLLPIPVRQAVIVGAGPIGLAHARLFARGMPRVRRIWLHDTHTDRAQAGVGQLRRISPGLGVEFEVAEDLRGAIAGSQLVVAATTSARPYLTLDLIPRGCLVANVGLDDCSDDVLLGADHLVVDDWRLIVEDPYRALGRLARERKVVGTADAVVTDGGRHVDAELPALVTGRAALRPEPTARVVLNPFGLAIHDIALATAVDEVARSGGGHRRNHWLTR